MAIIGASLAFDFEIIDWVREEDNQVGYTICFLLHRNNRPVSIDDIKKDLSDSTYSGKTIDDGGDYSDFLKTILSQDQLELIKKDYGSIKEAEEALDHFVALCNDNERTTPIGDVS